MASRAGRIVEAMGRRKRPGHAARSQARGEAIMPNMHNIVAGRARRRRALAPLVAFAATGAALAGAAPGAAYAHGIAGDRFFPATITTDDPFVASEYSEPTVSWFTLPGKPTTRETDYENDGSLLVLPNLAIGFSQAYITQHVKDTPSVGGWGNLNLNAMYQFFENDEHEAIVSASLGVQIGATGEDRIGAQRFDTFTPAVNFGKGMGDLPDSMGLLKPFAITGVIGPGLPDRAETTVNGAVQQNPNTFDWGFALEYSIPYLQSEVRNIGLGAPFNRMIPLVEVAMQTGLDRGQGGVTTGTVNPGVIWAGQTFQIGAEAMIPVNKLSGRGVGGIAQLHFYLDDMFPKVFAKPLFGN
jgi:hypothetical protein